MNEKKIISLLTLTCFLVSFVFGDVAHAALENGNKLKNLEENDRQSFIIPQGYGRITDSYIATNRGTTGTQRYPLVINIQDLHCNPEVQKNINNILSVLDKKYGLPKVYVEGAYGKVNTSWLCNIHDRSLQHEIIENLLTQGKLTGSEYYSAVANKPDLLQGIEDEVIHKENIVRLGGILEKMSTYTAKLKTLERDLAFMKAKYFSKENKRFNRFIEKHNAHAIANDTYYKTLLNYLETINKTDGKYNNITLLTSADLPAILAYLRLTALAKELDYKKISRQLAEFMRLVKSKVPFKVYNELLVNTDNFKKPEELYAYLSRLSKNPAFQSNGLDKRFGELYAFFEYTEKSQELNPLALLEEEKKLVEYIRIALSRDIAELEISFLSDFYSTFRDYLLAKLSAEDYDFFKNRFDRFKAVWNKYAFKDRVSELTADFELISEYYETNCKRNMCFLHNIEELGYALETTNASLHVEKGAANRNDPQATLDEQLKNSSIVVMVTGGFHTDGLKKLLRYRKISYITITPTITKDAALSNKTYEKFAREQAKSLAQDLSQPPTTRDIQNLMQATPTLADSDSLALGLASQTSSKTLFRLLIEGANKKLLHNGSTDTAAIIQAIQGSTGLNARYDIESSMITFDNGTQIKVARTQDSVTLRVSDSKPGSFVSAGVRIAIHALVTQARIMTALFYLYAGKPERFVAIAMTLAANLNLITGNGLLLELSQLPGERIETIEKEILARFPAWVQKMILAQKKKRDALQTGIDLAVERATEAPSAQLNEIFKKYIFTDPRTGEKVLHIYSDFEETVTAPYMKQKVTLIQVIASSIQDMHEREAFLADMKRIRDAIDANAKRGVVDENLYHEQYAIMGKHITPQHIQTMSELYKLQDAYTQRLESLAEEFNVDKVKITFVARGISQLFESFFEQEEVKNKLRHIVHTDEEGNLDIEMKANTFVFEGEVFQNKIVGAEDNNGNVRFVNQKQDFIPEDGIFTGDYRDKAYKLKYFIDVNSEESVHSSITKWIGKHLALKFNWLKILVAIDLLRDFTPFKNGKASYKQSIVKTIVTLMGVGIGIVVFLLDVPVGATMLVAALFIIIGLETGTFFITLQETPSSEFQITLHEIKLGIRSLLNDEKDRALLPAPYKECLRNVLNASLKVRAIIQLQVPEGTQDFPLKGLAPADLTREELNAYLEKLPPDEADAFLNPFTVIQRVTVEGVEKLKAVPFAELEEYEKEIKAICDDLELAAAVKGIDSHLRTYIKLVIAALKEKDIHNVRNAYTAADRAWLKTTNLPFTFILAPDDRYPDEMLAAKKFFCTSLYMPAREMSEKKRQYEREKKELVAYIDDFAAQAQDSAFTRALQIMRETNTINDYSTVFYNIFFEDEYFASPAIAMVQPDNREIDETVIMIFANMIKSNNLAFVAERMFNNLSSRFVTLESYIDVSLFHEIGHVLFPISKTRRKELEENFTVFYELSANLYSLFLTGARYSAGRISKQKAQEEYATFFASAMETFCTPSNIDYWKGYNIIFKALDKAKILKKEDDGRYTIRLDSETDLKTLHHQIGMLLATTVTIMQDAPTQTAREFVTSGQIPGNDDAITAQLEGTTFVSSPYYLSALHWARSDDNTLLNKIIRFIFGDKAKTLTETIWASKTISSFTLENLHKPLNFYTNLIDIKADLENNASGTVRAQANLGKKMINYVMALYVTAAYYYIAPMFLTAFTAVLMVTVPSSPVLIASFVITVTSFFIARPVARLLLSLWYLPEIKNAISPPSSLPQNRSSRSVSPQTVPGKSWKPAFSFATAGISAMFLGFFYILSFAASPVYTNKSALITSIYTSFSTQAILSPFLIGAGIFAAGLTLLIIAALLHYTYITSANNDQNTIIPARRLPTLLPSIDEQALYKTTMERMPAQVKWVLETLDQNGCQANLFGGALRDIALGLPPNDWDIQTNATKEMIEHFFGEHAVLIRETDEYILYELHFEDDQRKTISVGLAISTGEVDIVHKVSTNLTLSMNTIILDYGSKKIVNIGNGLEDLRKKVFRIRSTDVSPVAIFHLIKNFVRINSVYGDFVVEPETIENLKQHIQPASNSWYALRSLYDNLSANPSLFFTFATENKFLYALYFPELKDLEGAHQILQNIFLRLHEHPREQRLQVFLQLIEENFSTDTAEHIRKRLKTLYHSIPSIRLSLMSEEMKSFLTPLLETDPDTLKINTSPPLTQNQIKTHRFIQTKVMPLLPFVSMIDSILHVFILPMLRITELNAYQKKGGLAIWGSALAFALIAYALTNNLYTAVAVLYLTEDVVHTLYNIFYGTGTAANSPLTVISTQRKKPSKRKTIAVSSSNKPAPGRVRIQVHGSSGTDGHEVIGTIDGSGIWNELSAPASASLPQPADNDGLRVQVNTVLSKMGLRTIDAKDVFADRGSGWFQVKAINKNGEILFIGSHVTREKATPEVKIRAEKTRQELAHRLREALDPEMWTVVAPMGIQGIDIYPKGRDKRICRDALLAQGFQVLGFDDAFSWGNGRPLLESLPDEAPFIPLSVDPNPEGYGHEPPAHVPYLGMGVDATKKFLGDLLWHKREGKSNLEAVRLALGEHAALTDMWDSDKPIALMFDIDLTLNEKDGDPVRKDVGSLIHALALEGFEIAINTRKDTGYLRPHNTLKYLLKDIKPAPPVTLHERTQGIYVLPFARFGENLLRYIIPLWYILPKAWKAAVIAFDEEVISPLVETPVMMLLVLQYRRISSHFSWNNFRRFDIDQLFSILADKSGDRHIVGTLVKNALMKTDKAQKGLRQLRTLDALRQDWGLIHSVDDDEQSLEQELKKLLSRALNDWTLTQKDLHAITSLFKDPQDKKDRRPAMPQEMRKLINEAVDAYLGKKPLSSLREGRLKRIIFHHFFPELESGSNDLGEGTPYNNMAEKYALAHGYIYDVYDVKKRAEEFVFMRHLAWLNASAQSILDASLKPFGKGFSLPNIIKLSFTLHRQKNIQDRLSHNQWFNDTLMPELRERFPDGVNIFVSDLNECLNKGYRYDVTPGMVRKIIDTMEPGSIFALSTTNPMFGTKEKPGVQGKFLSVLISVLSEEEKREYLPRMPVMCHNGSQIWAWNEATGTYECVFCNDITAAVGEDFKRGLQKIVAGMQDDISENYAKFRYERFMIDLYHAALIVEHRQGKQIGTMLANDGSTIIPCDWNALENEFHYKDLKEEYLRLATEMLREFPDIMGFSDNGDNEPFYAFFDWWDIQPRQLDARLIRKAHHCFSDLRGETSPESVAKLLTDKIYSRNLIEDTGHSGIKLSDETWALISEYSNNRFTLDNYYNAVYHDSDDLSGITEDPEYDWLRVLPQWKLVRLNRSIMKDLLPELWSAHDPQSPESILEKVFQAAANTRTIKENQIDGNVYEIAVTPIGPDTGDVRELFKLNPDYEKRVNDLIERLGLVDKLQIRTSKTGLYIVLKGRTDKDYGLTAFMQLLADERFLGYLRNPRIAYQGNNFSKIGEKDRTVVGLTELNFNLDPKKDSIPSVLNVPSFFDDGAYLVLKAVKQLNREVRNKALSEKTSPFLQFIHTLEMEELAKLHSLLASSPSRQELQKFFDGQKSPEPITVSETGDGYLSISYGDEDPIRGFAYQEFCRAVDRYYKKWSYWFPRDESNKYFIGRFIDKIQETLNQPELDRLLAYFAHTADAMHPQVVPEEYIPGLERMDERERHFYMMGWHLLAWYAITNKRLFSKYMTRLRSLRKKLPDTAAVITRQEFNASKQKAQELQGSLAAMAKTTTNWPMLRHAFSHTLLPGWRKPYAGTGQSLSHLIAADILTFAKALPQARALLPVFTAPNIPIVCSIGSYLRETVAAMQKSGADTVELEFNRQKIRIQQRPAITNALSVIKSDKAGLLEKFEGPLARIDDGLSDINAFYVIENIQTRQQLTLSAYQLRLMENYGFLGGHHWDWLTGSWLPFSSRVSAATLAGILAGDPHVAQVSYEQAIMFDQGTPKSLGAFDGVKNALRRFLPAPNVLAQQKSIALMLPENYSAVQSMKAAGTMNTWQMAWWVANRETLNRFNPIQFYKDHFRVPEELKGNQDIQNYTQNRSRFWTGIGIFITTLLVPLIATVWAFVNASSILHFISLQNLSLLNQSLIPTLFILSVSTIISLLMKIVFIYKRYSLPTINSVGATNAKTPYDGIFTEMNTINTMIHNQENPAQAIRALKKHVFRLSSLRFYERFALNVIITLLYSKNTKQEVLGIKLLPAFLKNTGYLCVTSPNLRQYSVAKKKDAAAIDSVSFGPLTLDIYTILLRSNSSYGNTGLAESNANTIHVYYQLTREEVVVHEAAHIFARKLGVALPETDSESLADLASMLDPFTNALTLSTFITAIPEKKQAIENHEQARVNILLALYREKTGKRIKNITHQKAADIFRGISPFELAALVEAVIRKGAYFDEPWKTDLFLVNVKNVLPAAHALRHMYFDDSQPAYGTLPGEAYASTYMTKYKLSLRALANDNFSEALNLLKESMELYYTHDHAHAKHCSTIFPIEKLMSSTPTLRQLQGLKNRIGNNDEMSFSWGLKLVTFIEIMEKRLRDKQPILSTAPDTAGLDETPVGHPSAPLENNSPAPSAITFKTVTTSLVLAMLTNWACLFALTYLQSFPLAIIILVAGTATITFKFNAISSGKLLHALIDAVAIHKDRKNDIRSTVSLPDDMPQEDRVLISKIIQIIRQFDSYEDFDQWLENISENIEYGKNFINEDIELLELLCLVFSDKTNADERVRIIRDSQIKPENVALLERYFYRTNAYHFTPFTNTDIKRDRMWESIIRTTTGLLFSVARKTPEYSINIYSRRKHFKSLSLKLRKLVYKLTGKTLAVDNLPLLIETTMTHKTTIQDNMEALFDDLMGFNFIIDDTGFTPEQRKTSFDLFIPEIEHSFRTAFPGFKINIVRKAGRTPGYESVNIFIYGFLEHKELGSIPLRIQLRHKSAMLRESAMYFNYKKDDSKLWELPPWAQHIDFENIATQDRLMKTLFDELRDYSPDAQASRFDVQEFMTRLGHTTSSLTQRLAQNAAVIHFNSFERFVRGLTGTKTPVSLVDVESDMSGEFKAFLEKRFKEIGIPFSRSISVRNALIDPAALKSGAVLQADLEDTADRQRIGLTHESTDLVFLNNIVNTDVIDPALAILKENGALFITFAESDIQTDYRNILRFTKEKLLKLSSKDPDYNYILLGYDSSVPMPDDYPNLFHSFETMIVTIKVRKDSGKSAPLTLPENFTTVQAMKAAGTMNTWQMAWWVANKETLHRLNPITFYLDHFKLPEELQGNQALQSYIQNKNRLWTGIGVFIMTLLIPLLATASAWAIATAAFPAASLAPGIITTAAFLTAYVLNAFTIGTILHALWDVREIAQMENAKEQLDETVKSMELAYMSGFMYEDPQFPFKKPLTLKEWMQYAKEHPRKLPVFSTKFLEHKILDPLLNPMLTSCSAENMEVLAWIEGTNPRMEAPVLLCIDRSFGKNKLYVIFKGTPLNGWLTDFHFDYATPDWLNDPAIKLHEGFKNVFDSINLKAVIEAIDQVSREEKIDKIVLAGHSLGGALGEVFLGYVGSLRKEGFLGDIPVKLHAFAKPHVGNAAWRAYIESLGFSITRYVNAHDIVPQLPPESTTILWRTSRKTRYYIPTALFNQAVKALQDGTVSEELIEQLRKISRLQGKLGNPLYTIISAHVNALAKPPRETTVRMKELEYRHPGTKFVLDAASDAVFSSLLDSILDFINLRGLPHFYSTYLKTVYQYRDATLASWEQKTREAVNTFRISFIRRIWYLTLNFLGIHTVTIKSVSHIVRAAELRDAMKGYENTEGLAHIWITELPVPGQRPDNLHPLGILGAYYTTINGNLVFYVDFTTLENGPSDENLGKAGAQILRHLGGTDYAQGNRKSQRDIVHLAINNNTPEYRHMSFKPAVVINHMPLDTKHIAVEFSREGSNKAACVPSGDFTGLVPAEFSMHLHKRLVKQQSIDTTLAENKLIKLDIYDPDDQALKNIETLHEFREALKVFESISNRQMLINWGLFEHALAHKEIDEPTIHALLAQARKHGVLVYCEYDLNNGSLKKEYFTKIGFTDIISPDTTKKVSLDAIARTRIEPHDILDITIPEHMSPQERTAAFARINLSNMIILHSGDAARIIESEGVISDKLSSASLLDQLLNFGTKHISTPQKALRLGFNWDITPLMHLTSEQLDALMQNDFAKAGIDKTSAVYEQCVELKSPTLQLAFLRGVAAKSRIARKLQTISEKLSYDYLKGSFKFTNTLQEEMLGAALLKQEHMNTAHIAADIATYKEKQSTLKDPDTYIASLYRYFALNREEATATPEPGSIAAVIDIILTGFYADYNMRRAFERKDELFNINTVNAIIGAA